LAGVLAEPFGITVSKLPGADMGAPFPSFKLEQGETAFEALDRALKQRELLACSSSDGGIFILESGAFTSDTALVQGGNILSASADFDLTDRFSHYLVQGQQPGSDELYGLEACAVSGQARDAAMLRYRPYIVRAENRVDAGSARQRAAWEAAVRAARSVAVSVTLAGFRQDSGEYWQENTLVDVHIPYLYLDQQLLISKVAFRQDARSGSITTLELRDPASFAPEPKKQDTGGAPKDYKIEAEKDLQTRFSEEAAAQQSQIKEGKP
jgi:prophage tail gpP-like protein